MYKIESNIPVPSKESFGSVIKKMKVGDSVIIDAKERTKVSQYASYCGVKLKTKTIDGVLRMWRIA